MLISGWLLSRVIINQQKAESDVRVDELQEAVSALIRPEFVV